VEGLGAARPASLAVRGKTSKKSYPSQVLGMMPEPF
jgi:hypothetical protein